MYSGFLRSSEDGHPIESIIDILWQIDTKYHLPDASTCIEMSAFGAFDPAAFLVITFGGTMRCSR